MSSEMDITLETGELILKRLLKLTNFFKSKSKVGACQNYSRKMTLLRRFLTL